MRLTHAPVSDGTGSHSRTAKQVATASGGCTDWPVKEQAAAARRIQQLTEGSSGSARAQAEAEQREPYVCLGRGKARRHAAPSDHTRTDARIHTHTHTR